MLPFVVGQWISPTFGRHLISYHLYYGWNFVPIALWAVASVLVYLRIVRLLPSIQCHIAWDVAVPCRAFDPEIYESLVIIMLPATIWMTASRARWRPIQASSSTSA